MLTNCSYPITSRAPVQEENAMFAAVNIDRMPGSGKRYSPRNHNFVPFFSRIRPFRPGASGWPGRWAGPWAAACPRCFIGLPSGAGKKKKRICNLFDIHESPSFHDETR